MSETKQETLNFARSEQEAVAKAVRDFPREALALRNAKRRCRRMILGIVVVLLVWLIFSLTCHRPIMDWIMSLVLDMEVRVSWSMYFLGRCLGTFVGALFLLYSWSGICRESGWHMHIRIGRFNMPKRLLAVIGILVLLWLMILMIVHSEKVAYAATWHDYIFVTNLTGFMVELLTYSFALFSIATFIAPRKQLIKEEKWALGVFD